MSSIRETHSFVGSNLQAMPKYGPEELNLAVVVDRQVQTEVAIPVQKTKPPSTYSSAVVQQSL
jgi:hypothetical protein